MIPNSKRLWLHSYAQTWDHLSIHCVHFQVPYLHAGKHRTGWGSAGWGIAHTDTPNPGHHLTIYDRTQSGTNVMPCAMAFSGEWSSSRMTNHVGFIKTVANLCPRKSCEGSPPPHFGDFNTQPPPLANGTPRRMADRRFMDSGGSAVNFCLP